MRAGKKTIRCPETFWESEGEWNSPKRSMRGKVVYIHPKGRITAQFELPGGKVRESFQGVEE